MFFLLPFVSYLEERNGGYECKSIMMFSMELAALVFMDGEMVFIVSYLLPMFFLIPKKEGIFKELGIGLGLGLGIQA